MGFSKKGEPISLSAFLYFLEKEKEMDLKRRDKEDAKADFLTMLEARKEEALENLKITTSSKTKEKLLSLSKSEWEQLVLAIGGKGSGF